VDGTTPAQVRDVSDGTPMDTLNMPLNHALELTAMDCFSSTVAAHVYDYIPRALARADKYEKMQAVVL
jgi:hypothetical protein